MPTDIAHKYVAFRDHVMENTELIAGDSKTSEVVLFDRVAANGCTSGGTA